MGFREDFGIWSLVIFLTIIENSAYNYNCCGRCGANIAANNTYDKGTEPNSSPENDTRLDLHTEDNDTYQFFTATANNLHIRVKAKNDAHVALSNISAPNNPIYEVFFGGWGNTRSVIRKDHGYLDVVSKASRNILDPNVYKGFWIRWAQNSVSVGIEGSYNPIMKYTDPNPFDVKTIGFNTGWGSTGHWIIHSTYPIGNQNWTKAATVYDFSVKSIYGEEVPLNIYRGHVLIIVNVASYCKFANTHYPELAELQKRYKDKGLRVLIFPCNQFLNQEYSSNVQIYESVKKINPDFEIFDKVDVNGADALPLYNFLKFKQGGIITETCSKLNVSNLSKKLYERFCGNLAGKIVNLASGIKWNFTKFIINRQGIPIYRAGVDIKPLDTRFLYVLEKSLEENAVY